MKYLLATLILLLPSICLAAQATASWDSSGQDITYTVYKNGQALVSCTDVATLSCTVDKFSGDEFYVIAKNLDGDTSPKSRVSITPPTPDNFRVITVTVQVD